MKKGLAIDQTNTKQALKNKIRQMWGINVNNYG
jgi:hypothetical protein